MSQKISLLQGESIAFQLEADIYGGGANPVMQAIARVTAFIMKILGTRIKATLVVTNQRVIEYHEIITCWVIPTSVVFKVILPQSVKEVGYFQQTTCGCCSFFSLYYEAFTQRTIFPIKGGTQEIMNDYVSKFYAAIKA